MTTSLVEAFELVASAETLLPRLDAAAAELSKAPTLTDEKAWLEAGRLRLAAAKAGTADDLLTRALRLPELVAMKGDHARAVQGATVDALEHLQAAIVFVASARSPLLEALYYKLKIPTLRRCDRDEFEAFCGDFEKRLKTTYVRRMLGDATYAPVVSGVEKLYRAIATWRSIFIAEPAGEEEARPLRLELEQAARRLETAGRQAKLLAQAALVPLKDIDAAALLALKAKRKEDTHALLENDPPDPNDPTPEERAELEAAK